MKHTIQQVFQSGKFVTGFVILMAIVLGVIIYPLIIPDPPLKIIAQGTFFEPGIYVNVYDSIGSPQYTLNLDNAAERRIASRLNDDDRLAIKEWLVGNGMSEGEIDTANTEQLLDQWFSNFDPAIRLPGMTNADRNYYIRLNKNIQGLLKTEGVIISEVNPETGVLEEEATVPQSA
ncbi:MAG: hypothetical protein P8183_10145 [Anaerolineae bacterium]